MNLDTGREAGLYSSAVQGAWGAPGGLAFPERLSSAGARPSAHCPAPDPGAQMSSFRHSRKQALCSFLVGSCFWGRDSAQGFLLAFPTVAW